MLGDIFYFVLFCIFLLGIVKLFNISKIVEVSNWIQKFKKVTNKNPSKGDFKSEEDWKITLAFGVISIFEFYWILFGVLSDNWKIFILLILLGLSFNLLNRYLNLFLKKIASITFNVLKLCLIGVLVINHFHFHLDVWKIFTQFLHSTF